jgi:heme exporter protein A
MSENGLPSPNHILFVKALRKTFGLIQALRGIDLELFKGEFLTIFGPNGAGKTTLIKILSSLARPTSGTAYVAGFNIEDADPQMRSQIGVISHASYLYDNLSALENLVFYAKMHRLDNPEERAAQVIDEVGLKARMHDPVGVFSRGMTQRLSIARAIINSPAILFLDEPYTGLDQHASENLKERLSVLRDAKRSIVMITHDIPRGLEMCDRVAIMADGKKAFMGHVDDVDKDSFEDFYYQTIANSRADKNRK